MTATLTADVPARTDLPPGLAAGLTRRGHAVQPMPVLFDDLPEESA